MKLSIDQINHFMQMAWTWTTLFVPRLAAGLALLIIGLLIAGWVARGLRRLLTGMAHVDPALKPIIVAVARYAIIVLTIIATLEQLGFQTTSLLAVLGAAGLAVGLALQGTLSNIASGIMLLWLRPFQVGDFIEVSSQSGSVDEIGLFGCKLRTFDGMLLFMPNSSIWSAPLKNHTRNNGRLISIDVSLPPAAELASSRATILAAAKSTADVLTTPQPKVFMEGLTTTALILTLTLWSRPQNAGDVERSVIEKIKHAFDAMDEKSRPIQIVRTVPNDADPSRFLESRQPLPLGQRYD